MRGRVGCTFNKMIRLGFFKLSFDKMLKGNRVSTQRYLAKKKKPVQGIAVRTCTPVQGTTRKRVCCGWKGGWGRERRREARLVLLSQQVPSCRWRHGFGFLL